jgi:hypothetical protein
MFSFSECPKNPSQLKQYSLVIGFFDVRKISFYLPLGGNSAFFF